MGMNQTGFTRETRILRKWFARWTYTIQTDQVR